MAGSLDLLRTFLAVYRAGSLTAAAAQLHLSQPAVSKQLHALEQQRGRPLFVRGARGVVPTHEAHVLARDVGPHLDALEAVAVASADAPAATVHFGGPADLLALKVAPALAPAAARGELRLRLSTGIAETVLDRLATDEEMKPTRSPDWDLQVLKLTSGLGADLVLDTVGTATFTRSLQPGMGV